MAAVREYLAVQPASPGYFLIHADFGPLTKFQIDCIMAASLARAGLACPHKKYSSHSFRIGAATAVYKVGMGPEGIKKVGSWQLQCFQRYIRA